LELQSPEQNPSVDWHHIARGNTVSLQESAGVVHRSYASRNGLSPHRASEDQHHQESKLLPDIARSLLLDRAPVLREWDMKMNH